MLPAMTFLILCLIQLTMMQHARIMTDYAAFCAARAGIVFNADKEAMEQAATIALTPTMGRTDTLLKLGETYLYQTTIEKVRRTMFNRLPLVRITTLSPKRSAFTPANTRHLNGRELDFDDLRPTAAAANQLQIELKYLYKMRVPFANQILQTIFFAQSKDLLKYWNKGFDLTNPRGPGDLPVRQISRAAYLSADDEDAIGIVAGSYAGHYYFPIRASYTMRMQSNVHLRNAGN